MIFLLHGKSIFSYKQTLLDVMKNDMICFLHLVLYLTHIGILQKFGYEEEISILEAFLITYKVLEW